MPERWAGTPLVLQAEQAECGIASLTMIAGHFGHQLDLNAVRRRFTGQSDGASLRSILAIADALGLTARPVRLEIEQLSRLALPAILHWQFDHFVVLTHVRRRGAVLHDPAAGRRRISQQQLSEGFTGVAIEFSRAPEFVPQASAYRSLFGGLMRSFDGLTRFVAAMLALLFVTQTLALIPPVATQLLIDNVVLGQDSRWLHEVLAGLALVMLTMTIVDGLRRWIALYAGTRLATDSTTAVVSHLLHLPFGTIAQRPVGDLLSRVESLRPIRKAMLETALAGLVQLVVTVTTVAVMLYYSLQLTLISVTALCVIAAFHAAALPAMRAQNMESLLASAQASNSLIESLRSFQSMRILGLESQRLVHWQRSFLTATNAGARQIRLGIVVTFAHGVVSAAEQLLFLAIGISGVVGKHLTLGILFAFLSLRGRLSGAVLQLVATLRELYLLRSHVQRVGEIVTEKAEPRAHDGAVRDRIRGAIACRRISFHYPGAGPVLQDFDCTIEAGESVVIVGRSGAGKSTLLQLMSGALMPCGGSVLIDGVELHLWDLSILRRQIGVVLQHDRLFQGSVADNISCFEAAPDLARVREAAQAASVWTELQAFPMTVHTLVGTSGAGFSGGQLQRILLARALYRQPGILFLDEATSHLDGATESRVFDNLAAMRLTIVSVAHREQAMSRGDRVVHLGRCAE